MSSGGERSFLLGTRHAQRLCNSSIPGYTINQVCDVIGSTLVQVCEVIGSTLVQVCGVIGNTQVQV